MARKLGPAHHTAAYWAKREARVQVADAGRQARAEAAVLADNLSAARAAVDAIDEAELSRYERLLAEMLVATVPAVAKICAATGKPIEALTAADVIAYVRSNPAQMPAGDKGA